MNFIFKKIAIIGIHKNSAIAETVEYLARLLIEYSIKVYLESRTARQLSYKFGSGYTLKLIANSCDIAIIVGGDGNFLAATKELSLLGDIPIIGINRGKLGFLTDINPNELSTRLFDVLKGNYQKQKRFMLKASVKGKCHHISFRNMMALNDIIINTGQMNRLFQMRINIDGYHAFDQRADGIIIATPTGSTAHALSAGGPIIHPKVNGIVILPILSHSLNSRPIILNANCNIQITIDKYNSPNPNLYFDGQINTELSPGDTIELSRCKKYVNLLYPMDYDYFGSLRSKLHWSTMLFP